MALLSIRAVIDRYLWNGINSNLAKSSQKDKSRRCNMDSARCVALAWCYGNNYNDPYNYSRIAIQEKINGKAVEWLGKVSDKECEEVQSASD
ncbi:hypothetical protein SiH_2372 [Sulfolobus islandicus HVE10/4]|uniref:Uncharacterized protein n=3 Tax=Saccharolobus islandicus TaxID=43080 RepID=F0ND75_SACI5|nr:hypothetical protein SiH_2372 [Sulfolobus islandicus HVE10/4]ADX86372.1 hypothetical protein SiRe_2322 [Sulfolobus islandicus REY15A]